MSRDGADRDPTIPVKSTSTCIWSCTGLTLSPSDKRQQTNDMMGWVCFRLHLKLLAKTWADLKTSQRQNYFVSVCVKQLTITIFITSAINGNTGNGCGDEDYGGKAENERKARMTPEVGRNNNLDRLPPQCASAPAAITVQHAACSCNSDLHYNKVHYRAVGLFKTIPGSKRAVA